MYLLALVLGSVPATPSQFQTLDVPEFSPALLRLPSGERKGPVLVVTHGAGGTAEAHCALWARIAPAHAVLLCLRGRARSRDPAAGEYYPDHLQLERETFAALGALRARYSARLAEGPVSYAGFSQGATMGALMLVDHAGEVPRLALVEGGYADWSLHRAKQFRDHGGQRVLFVCGRKACADAARSAARCFEAAGIPAKVEHVLGAGHSHDARVEARLVSSWGWLVNGDARWSD